MEVLNFCRDNGIEIVGFPPNATHFMQPPDVSLFGPFKHYLGLARAAWAQRGVVSRANIAALVSQALLAAAKPSTIKAGWVGITPPDPDLIIRRFNPNWKRDTSSKAAKSESKSTEDGDATTSKQQSDGETGVHDVLMMVDGREVRVRSDFRSWINTLSTAREAPLPPLVPAAAADAKEKPKDKWDLFFGEFAYLADQSSLAHSDAPLAVPAPFPKEEKRKGLARCKFSRILTSDEMVKEIEQAQTAKHSKAPRSRKSKPRTAEAGSSSDAKEAKPKPKPKSKRKREAKESEREAEETETEEEEEEEEEEAETDAEESDEELIVDKGDFLVVALAIDKNNSRPFGLVQAESEILDTDLVKAKPFLPVDHKDLFGAYAADDGSGLQQLPASSVLWNVGEDTMDVDDEVKGHYYLPQSQCTSLRKQFKKQLAAHRRAL